MSFNKRLAVNKLTSNVKWLCIKRHSIRKLFMKITMTIEEYSEGLASLCTS